MAKATVFRSVNPFTGAVIAEYEADSHATLSEKTARAFRTFGTWSGLSPDQRADCFLRLATCLRNHRERLATLITTEMGKILREAREEVDKCAGQCEYYARQAGDLLRPQPIVTDGSRSFVAYEPAGVVLAIMPWNFPFWQVFRYAVPALMAGNVTLLKHAPSTFGCAHAIEAAFLEAGFPEGVFQNIRCDTDAVPALLADSRVAMVTLTGSEKAGAAVAAVAGANIKKSILELGGSDPLIVLADADIAEAAAAAVQSRMSNAGQVCIAAKRWLVDHRVLDAFTHEVGTLIGRLRTGDPMLETTDIGPLARPDLAEQLGRQLESALRGGARLLAGGTWRDCLFQPTLLDGVTPGNTVFREETFGPLAAMTGFDGENEAIRLANATPYGLGAAVWTRDTGRAVALSRRLEAGTVFVNAVVRSDYRLPIGGVKRSGYGRELAEAGIRDFCVVKSVYVR